MEQIILAHPMVTLQQGVLGGLAALGSIVYFAVGSVQAKRQVSAEARPALMGFIIWWVGLGLIGLLSVFFQFGPALEQQSMTVIRIVLYSMFGAIFVMLAGLVYYLLYLYTGKPNGLYIVAAFYCVFVLFFVWLLEAHAPHVGMIHPGEPNEGEVAFHLHDPIPQWAELTLAVALLLPPLAATIAYGLLFFRTKDRTARFRIAMVSVGFILWFGFSLFGSVARSVTNTPEQSFAGEVAGQLLGLLAAVLVLLAYNPPRSLRQRLHLRSIDEPLHGDRDVFETPRNPPGQRRLALPEALSGSA